MNTSGGGRMTVFWVKRTNELPVHTLEPPWLVECDDEDERAKRAIIPSEDERKRMLKLADWWDEHGQMAGPDAVAELTAILREVAGYG